MANRNTEVVTITLMEIGQKDPEVDMLRQQNSTAENVARMFQLMLEYCDKNELIFMQVVMGCDIPSMLVARKIPFV